MLRLALKLGAMRLGRVAIDGSKVKANASKHKAMSYRRMQEDEKRLKEKARRLLAEAEQADKEEDRRYGRAGRAEDLPAELARREERLKRIRTSTPKSNPTETGRSEAPGSIFGSLQLRLSMEDDPHHAAVGGAFVFHGNTAIPRWWSECRPGTSASRKARTPRTGASAAHWRAAPALSPSTRYLRTFQMSAW